MPPGHWRACGSSKICPPVCFKRCSTCVGKHKAAPALQCRAAKDDQKWKIGFQCNERYLQWGESGQGRFLKLYCGEKLGWSPVKVEEELRSLVALLPGLELRFERMKADLLLRLLARQDTIVINMIALRAALPAADIAAIVAHYPALLTDFSAQLLTERIADVREALPGVEEIDGMVEAEPRILTVDVEWLLSEIERLLPGQDAQQLLSQNPSSMFKLVPPPPRLLDDEYAM